MTQEIPPRPFDLDTPVEPITLAEARAHLNLVPDVDSDGAETHPDDSVVSAFLTAAREWAEGVSGYLVGDRSVLVAFDAFPAGREPFELGFGGAYELVDIQFLAAGEWRSIAAQSSSDEEPLLGAELDPYSMPARLLLASGNGMQWPTADAEPGAVRVTVSAGARPLGVVSSDGFPPPIPSTYRSAILLVLGHLYEHREQSVDRALTEIPLGAEILLRKHQVQRGFA